MAFLMSVMTAFLIGAMVLVLQTTQNPGGDVKALALFLVFFGFLGAAAVGRLVLIRRRRARQKGEILRRLSARG
jgi:hypothetical protein